MQQHMQIQRNCIANANTNANARAGANFNAMHVRMNLGAHTKTNATQLHTGANANVKRMPRRCRCRRSKCNTKANMGANALSEVDRRGRKTKLRYMDSGTNANAIHLQLQHQKLINAVAKKMCNMDLGN